MPRLFFALIIVVFLSCNSKEHQFDSTTYEKAKESISDKEKKNPERFLSVTSSDKRNWLGKEVISGVVHSRATVCTYKNVKLKILFIDKAGVVLKEGNETINDFISPNDSKSFKFRYSAPRETDDIKITIVDAKVDGN